MNTGVYDKMREILKKYHVSNCSIRSKDCIYIIFEDHQEDDKNADVLLSAGFYYPKTERVWGCDGFRNVYKGKSCVLPNGPAILVDYNGQVLLQTGETEKKTKFKFEKRLPLIRQISVLQVREIDGKAYMAGTLRTVFRREGPNKWTCLSGNDLAVRDEEDKEERSYGFEDIDGFTANDIYACGGEGDICHYDGKEWTEVPCPTNVDLMSICCAGNGKVYAGGIEGYLIEGRGDSWKVIHKGGNLWIESLAWYKDKLYLATGMGLYEYHNGKIERTPGLSGISIREEEDTNSQKRIKNMLAENGADKDMVEFTDRISVSNEGVLAPSGLHTVCTDGELLVLGGRDSVVVFNGESWKMLYATYGDKGGFLDF